jgi:hypothetical protein
MALTAQALYPQLLVGSPSRRASCSTVCVLTFREGIVGRLSRAVNRPL